jgi:hypothetical protein
MVVQRVEASLSVVWSLVRRFDEAQIYKQFIRNCSIRGEGDLKVKVGCLREVQVVSGLPATNSTEKLDIPDEEQHILSFNVVGICFCFVSAFVLYLFLFLFKVYAFVLHLLLLGIQFENMYKGSSQ